MARKKLGDILIQAGVLDEMRLRAALAEQKRWGGPLGRILVEKKFVAEEALVQALSQQLHFPVARLEAIDVPRKVLDLVPVEFCEQHQLVPFGLEGKFLDVAMDDPTKLGVIDDLRIRTRLNVRAYLAGPRALERAISLLYYGHPLPGDGGIDMGPISLPPAGAFEVQHEREPARPVRDPLGLVQDEEAAARALAATTPVSDLPKSRSTSPRFAQGPVVFAEPGTAPGAASPIASAAPPASAAPQKAAVPSAADEEIAALRARIGELEALVARDEDVLRKLMGLLIQKGIFTHAEILEQLK